MFRSFVSLGVIVSLLVTTVFAQTVSAATKEEKEAKQAEKIKQKVAKIGTGEDARITVGLKNQKSLKGYVTEVGGDNFVVTNLKTKETTTVTYRDVAYVHGKGLSKGAKIAMYSLIGVGVFFVVLLIYGAATGFGD
jgi:hypothetical protein